MTMNSKTKNQSLWSVGILAVAALSVTPKEDSAPGPKAFYKTPAKEHKALLEFQFEISHPGENMLDALSEKYNRGTAYAVTKLVKSQDPDIQPFPVGSHAVTVPQTELEDRLTQLHQTDDINQTEIFLNIKNPIDLRMQVNEQTGLTGYCLHQALSEIKLEHGMFVGSRFVYINQQKIESKHRSVVQKEIVADCSHYGPGFHGRRTASGDIFNQYAMTAAINPKYREYLGHYAAVTNMDPDRPNYLQTVIVKLNDLGPWQRSGGRWIPHKKRGIDLSIGAGTKLGSQTNGKVLIEILSTSQDEYQS